MDAPRRLATRPGKRFQVAEQFRFRLRQALSCAGECGATPSTLVLALALGACAPGFKVDTVGESGEEWALAPTVAPLLDEGASERARAASAEALRYHTTSVIVRWRYVSEEETEYSGSTVVLHSWRTVSGARCRRLEQSATVRKRTTRALATACHRSGEPWHIIWDGESEQ